MKSVLVVLVLLPTFVQAQYNPYQLNPYNPYGPNPYFPSQPAPYSPPPVQPPPTAREKRAERDKAAKYAGDDENARSFIESCDEASEAAFGCSQPVATKLAAFHCSGALAKLPRPRDLLSAIGKQGMGDDVAVWVMQHGKDLEDADSFDAFMDAPLDYALGLKRLSDGAAEVKANRAAQFALPFGIKDWKPVAGIAGAVAIVCLGIWRIRARRRAAALGV